MGKGVGKFLMTKSQQVQCTSILFYIYPYTFKCQFTSRYKGFFLLFFQCFNIKELVKQTCII